jgi:hypothetical protein
MEAVAAVRYELALRGLNYADAIGVMTLAIGGLIADASPDDTVRLDITGDVFAALAAIMREFRVVPPQ